MARRGSSKSFDPTPKANKREKIPPKSKLTLAIVGVCGLATVALGVLIAGYSYIQYRYNVVPKGPERSAIVQIAKGSGLSTIAAQLEREGHIDNAFMFKLATKLNGGEGRFKAGEFAIARPASMKQIFIALSQGKAILYPFTAAEGLTSAQILRALDAVPTLSGELPQVPEEGTLLPETYLTPRGMTKAALIKDMQDAQTALMDELWEGRAPDLPIKTKAEAIILASVVEKETGIAAERPQVAAVFTNRLRRGMRLESDPTIIYGLTGGEPLGRGLRRSELDRPNKWNTYQIDGLPPTAICNPGRDAIAAVLNPPKSEFLFFVADGSGGHAFASTYAQHLKNVQNWRKVEAQRRAQ